MKAQTKFDEKVHEEIKEDDEVELEVESGRFDVTTNPFTSLEQFMNFLQKKGELNKTTNFVSLKNMDKRF